MVSYDPKNHGQDISIDKFIHSVELENGIPVKPSQMMSISPGAVAPEDGGKKQRSYTQFFTEQRKSLNLIDKKQDHMKSYGRMTVFLLLSVAAISFFASWGGIEVSKESHVTNSATLTSKDGYAVATASAYNLGSTYDFLTQGEEKVNSFITDTGLYADVYASYKSEKGISLFSHAGVMTVFPDDTLVFEETSVVQDAMDTHHMVSKEDNHKMKLNVGKFKVTKPPTPPKKKA